MMKIKLMKFKMMLKIMFSQFSFLVLLLTTGCTSGKTSFEATPTLPAQDFSGPESAMESAAGQVARVQIDPLTEEMSQWRKSILGKIHYQLFFNLDDVRSEFTGTAKLTFEVLANPRQLNRPLRVDFHGGRIEKILLNDAALNFIDYNGSYLLIPQEKLRTQTNTLFIQFSHPYGKSGEGLNRFYDHEDHLVYLYSQTGPYAANQIFPCFDQPDLKATFTLKVKAPRDWSVGSAVMESQKELLGETILWNFPESDPLSTYAFPLMAGPYDIFQSQYQSTEKKGEESTIPLRLWIRKSLASSASAMDEEEWFRLTQEGMRYLENYLGRPFPFKKYDQILVPDFTFKARENGGMASFSEKLIFNESFPQGPQGQQGQREVWTFTLLQKLAQMWTSQIGTMTWWNDLWFNEGLAIYLAQQALPAVSEFKEASLTYFHRLKQAAYLEDQSPTVHALESPIPNSSHAKAHFDAITLGKGAALFRQLEFLLGEKSWQKALPQLSDKNLGPWFHLWVQKEGLNTVEVEMVCADGLDQKGQYQGRIQSFKLLQRKWPLRPHKTQVALFALTPQGKLEPYRIQEVAYEGAVTSVPQLTGEICPSLVYPNYQDWDYVKVLLDEQSLSTLKKHFSQLSSPLDRGLLWHVLWERVLDLKESLSEFALFTLAHLEKEGHPLLKDEMISFLSRKLPLYLPRETADPSAYQSITLPLLKKVEDALLKDPLSEALITFGHSPHVLGQLKDALTMQKFSRPSKQAGKRHKQRRPKQRRGEGKGKGTGKEAKTLFDQDRRWKVLYQLSRYGVPLAHSLIQQEAKWDSSVEGGQQWLAAEVVAPTESNKKKWWDILHQDQLTNGMGLTQLTIIMQSLFPAEQIHLQRPFRSLFYSQLPLLSKSREENFLVAYVRYLSPRFCEQENLLLAKDFLKGHPQLPKVVEKELKAHIEEEERCLKIRSLLTPLDLPDPV